jgi:hypothetical protein
VWNSAGRRELVLWGMTMNATTSEEPGPAVIGDVPAVCPFCHTEAAAMVQSALAAGGYWLCARCGQTWDANRLATQAAYANYAERAFGPALAVR